MTKHESGVALILVLLLTSFLSAMGLGLALVVFMDQLAGGNHRGSVTMLYAADAGIELAARDLSFSADWDAVLAGLETGSLTDGPPQGVKAIPGGGTVNLTAETNTLNCGRVTSCTQLQMDAVTRDRPWGANNPRWRLYAYGPLQNVAGIARPAPCYLAVWVADDSREADDDPLADAGQDQPGRGVVRVRAQVFGPSGARRAIEAELARVCEDASSEEVCLPGIRVQSWQEIRHLVP